MKTCLEHTISGVSYTGTCIFHVIKGQGGKILEFLPLSSLLPILVWHNYRHNYGNYV